jgi:Stage II sporulation protein E (SpoIIE)
MRNRGARRFVSLVFFCAGLFGCEASADAQVDIAQKSSSSPTFVLRDLGRATVPLDGLWQFKTGDDPAWASANFDDSSWQQIEVGRPWEGQGHPDYTGFGWYRLHLVLPDNAPTNWNLALLLPYVQDACEVYWNGELVGEVGKVPPHPSWSVRPAPTAVLLGVPRSGVLAMRVWKAPHVYLSDPDEGGLVGLPQAGSLEAVNALVDRAAYRKLQSQLFQLAEQLISVLVGLLALFAWLRDRRHRMLGWLALAMVYPFFGIFLFGTFASNSFAGFYGLVGPIVTINDIASWFLLIYLLGLDDNKSLIRWTKILSIVGISLALVDSTMVCFDWTRLFPRFFLVADVAATIPELLLEFYIVVIFLFAIRKRQDAARWALALFALISNFLQGASDILGLGARWTHWTIASKLATPLVSIGGTALTASSLVGALFLASILYVAWRYSAEQSGRQNMLEQEYRSAQELQQVLIPDALPTLPSYGVTSAYRPAQEVGGDFFQLIALPNDAAMLVIGDVSGKGLPAAMAVAMIVGAIRSTVETTNDPAVVLSALNRRIEGRLRGGFATCLAMHLDAQGRCVVANAGHLPPYLNGHEVTLPAALPLGMIEDLEFESMQLQMARGERLTLYTDGLLEARNVAGELFGFKRIADLLTQPRDAQEIAEAAQAFGQEDDITVLSLKFVSA